MFIRFSSFTFFPLMPNPFMITRQHCPAKPLSSGSDSYVPSLQSSNNKNLTSSLPLITCHYGPQHHQYPNCSSLPREVMCNLEVIWLYSSTPFIIFPPYTEPHPLSSVYPLSSSHLSI